MPYDSNGRYRGLWAIVVLTTTCFFITSAHADLNSIGVTVLQSVTTNLDGSGIRVAQPEADVDTNQPPSFEVNPATPGNSPDLFSYYSSVGTTNGFPNSVGNVSWHAGQVAQILYGLSGGVATNVGHVDCYDADFFVNSFVAKAIAINARIVNQSFIFTGVNIAQQEMIDSAYDDYANQFSTLFVSGIGNGGAVNPPATCYNGIGVAAYGGASSVGPTLDNGRAKPDITAPAGATSYSTPQVSGAAVLLLQAAVRGDGGSDTNSAADIRTLKALLLNGAIKPADWTNSTTAPLDSRYGAGVLNVFNSYEQLAGGKNGFVAATLVPTNSPHPPAVAVGTVPVLSGWDFNSITSSPTSDALNHYLFNVTDPAGAGNFAATVTLVWNRQKSQTSINDLDLFLYDAASGNLIASSTSPVDNVEQLFIPQLAQGRYDLQVLKHGGNMVSTNESYALAFEFFNMKLTITPAGPNAIITWPVYPAGFVLESEISLAVPNWTSNNLTPIVSGGVFSVTVPSAADGQLFRLRRP